MHVGISAAALERPANSVAVATEPRIEEVTVTMMAAVVRGLK
jgi:hypothetical protein